MVICGSRLGLLWIIPSRTGIVLETSMIMLLLMMMMMIVVMVEFVPLPWTSSVVVSPILAPENKTRMPQRKVLNFDWILMAAKVVEDKSTELASHVTQCTLLSRFIFEIYLHTMSHMFTQFHSSSLADNLICLCGSYRIETGWCLSFLVMVWT